MWLTISTTCLGKLPIDGHMPTSSTWILGIVIVTSFYPQTLTSSELKCYLVGNLILVLDMKLPLTTSAEVSGSSSGHG